jgi:hypothetical protein
VVGEDQHHGGQALQVVDPQQLARKREQIAQRSVVDGVVVAALVLRELEPEPVDSAAEAGHDVEQVAHLAAVDRVAQPMPVDYVVHAQPRPHPIGVLARPQLLKGLRLEQRHLPGQLLRAHLAQARLCHIAMGAPHQLRWRWRWQRGGGGGTMGVEGSTRRTGGREVSWGRAAQRDEVRGAAPAEASRWLTSM